MVIDLPPYVEQVLIQQAQAQGVSVADLVMQKFGLTRAEPQQEEVNPMIARALALPKSSCFDGYDAVELQREWRDEWR